MKVAVVGATGLVGTRMLEVLAERNFPVTELYPVASSKSVGRKIVFKGKEWTVVSADDAIAARPEEMLPESLLLSLPRQDAVSLTIRPAGEWTRQRNLLFLKSTETV